MAIFFGIWASIIAAFHVYLTVNNVKVLFLDVKATYEEVVDVVGKGKTDTGIKEKMDRILLIGSAYRTLYRFGILGFMMYGFTYLLAFWVGAKLEAHYSYQPVLSTYQFIIVMSMMSTIIMLMKALVDGVFFPRKNGR